jgi:hypothetical protein
VHTETEHFRLVIADMADELSKRRFTFSVFTQPRPNSDIGRQAPGCAKAAYHAGKVPADEGTEWASAATDAVF